MKMFRCRKASMIKLLALLMIVVITTESSSVKAKLYIDEEQVYSDIVNDIINKSLDNTDRYKPYVSSDILYNNNNSIICDTLEELIRDNNVMKGKLKNFQVDKVDYRNSSTNDEVRLINFTVDNGNELETAYMLELHLINSKSFIDSNINIIYSFNFWRY